MTTIKKVQKAIDKAELPLEFVRGEGYHYFIYDNPALNIFETISVNVPYTSQMSVERWLEEAKQAYQSIKSYFDLT